MKKNFITNTISMIMAIGFMANMHAQNTISQSNNQSLFINTAPRYSTITINQFVANSVLTDTNKIVRIVANMEHSWLRDLSINLTCPNGQSVVLHNYARSGGAGFISNPVRLGVPISDSGSDSTTCPVGTTANYAWQPSSSLSTMHYGQVLGGPTRQLTPTNYRSFDALSGLVGCPMNGEWTLGITDYWNGDSGWLLGWTLEINGQVSPDFLPIELKSFTGFPKNNINILHWTTISEKNNVGFEIQRSNDGKNWEKIGWVNGQLNSTTPFYYTFEDNSFENTTSLYRLKQIDNDGKFSFSDIISIVNEKVNTPHLVIYPNPAYDKIRFDFDNFIVQNVRIYNINGSLLSNNKLTTNEIDISHLTSGYYILELDNGKKTIKKEFFKAN